MSVSARGMQREVATGVRKADRRNVGAGGVFLFCLGARWHFWWSGLNAWDWQTRTGQRGVAVDSKCDLGEGRHS